MSGAGRSLIGPWLPLLRSDWSTLTLRTVGRSVEPSLSPGANHRHNLSSGRVDPEHISDTFSFSSPPSDVPVNIMVAEAEAGTISDDLVVTKYKMAAEITNSKFKVQRSTRYYICMSTSYDAIYDTPNNCRGPQRGCDGLPGLGQCEGPVHAGRHAAHRGDQQGLQEGQENNKGKQTRQRYYTALEQRTLHMYIIPGHRVPHVSVSESRHLPLLAAGVRG